jgi:hypothetical protein
MHPSTGLVAMGIDPIFVDFSARPERTANASVRADRATGAGDHWVLDAGGSVSVDFTVGGEPTEVTLKIRALVSKIGPASGHAPLDVLVNEHTLVSRFRIPGGGDLPQEMTFAIPEEWLTEGTNTLRLRSADDARTMLWLYRVLMESVWDRDAAERALLADGAKESAFTFATACRPAGASDWRPCPRLRFWIDGAVPAELTWRGRDGTEAAVSFAHEMTGFLGHCRTATGDWLQLRGELTDRRVEPYGPAWRFTTETGWGGGWHRDGELTVHLDPGFGPVERIGWRDQRPGPRRRVVHRVPPEGGRGPHRLPRRRRRARRRQVDLRRPGADRPDGAETGHRRHRPVRRLAARPLTHRRGRREDSRGGLRLSGPWT